MSPRASRRRSNGRPRPEVDDGGFLDERAGVVVDPVPRKWACAGETRLEVPSALIVSSSVDHAIEGQNWTNGRRFTGRGVGMPIRPPTVWTNRTEFGPTSGAFWMSGRWTAANRIAAGPEPNGRRTDAAPAEVALPDDPAVLDLDVRSELVGLAEAVGGAERLEVVDAVGRWLVVVGDTHVERDPGHALDGLRRDPRDRGNARFMASSSHGFQTSGARGVPLKRGAQVKQSLPNRVFRARWNGARATGRCRRAGR